ncbi:hypothetical protein IFO70_20180 [Phormidium tenue FACHB-886]|nr:hypothetical protein [Phormidium tenue FACHB-886]
MNEDAAYTVFFAFGIVWIVIGAVGVIALLKVDNQPLQFGKWGILVALPIVIGIVAALVIAAVMSH